MFVMASTRHGWSVEEDVCIVFFASKGVQWEAIVDILPHLCGQIREPGSVYSRVSDLENELALFSHGKVAWDKYAVSSYYRTQALDHFLRKLRFSKGVLSIILKV